MSTNEIHRDLLDAGVKASTAAAISRHVARPESSSPLTMLATTTGIGFVVVLAAIGWLLVEINRTDDKLQAAIEANRVAIEAVRSDITELKVESARIGTLLDERLPSRP